MKLSFLDFEFQVLCLSNKRNVTKTNWNCKQFLWTMYSSVSIISVFIFVQHDSQHLVLSVCLLFLCIYFSMLILSYSSHCTMIYHQFYCDFHWYLHHKEWFYKVLCMWVDYSYRFLCEFSDAYPHIICLFLVSKKFFYILHTRLLSDVCIANIFFVLHFISNNSILKNWN